QVLRLAERQARVIVHAQIRDLSVRADRHRATSTSAPPAHPGAAVIRAIVQTVARARHPAHGDHGRICAAGVRHVHADHPINCRQGGDGCYPEDAASLARRAGTVPGGQTGGCDAYASCGNHHGVSLLEISVAAGEAGPVLTLSGEADLTTV